jgi:hypothetical protein
MNTNTMRAPLFVFMAGFTLLATMGCKDTNRGQSSANESPVPDGEIVLLKRSNEVAAFILKHQKMSPEQMDFEWFYRSDGKGTFTAGDTAVMSGYSSNASQVVVSNFTVQWSGNTTAKGWVYFSSAPTQLTKTADFTMCVTTETDISKIDANDPKWKYRERPKINVKALIESQIK